MYGRAEERGTQLSLRNLDASLYVALDAKSGAEE
jgi:hypothetical protein